ncbi:Endonuclease/exonuclease/phosphatase [Calycina marina]|uniref:CCR4-Not complex 3'-5'-exoribonuclease subunit Ccr4 n=1 Tax=Calycina marina TaxID=1763456 RepID=A0A9P7YZ82_9HELO|nr:Endonuclease/exonuclease/phosphatase [Calycina marina]
MADAYRFGQQTAGGFFHQAQAQHPRHHGVRNSTPPNNTRSPFTNDAPPSPSRSPDSHSPAHGVYNMYQGQQQHQHGRVNGGAGRGMQSHMNMYNNYQQPNSHQQHQQQHAVIQQDNPNAHTSNTGVANHHPYSNPGTTPVFVPASLNGHPATTRGGQMVEILEHWKVVLQAHSETQAARLASENGTTHHWARTKSGENRNVPQPLSNSTEDPDTDMNNRISNALDPTIHNRQEWSGVDMTGQKLRVLSKALFDFNFLSRVYIGANKIDQLPAWFGQLRALTHLDVSNNELTSLPVELGMCVYLRTLYAFDNKIKAIPTEFGSLFRLETLGLIGNSLLARENEDIRQNGTTAYIKHLLEGGPIPLPPPPREIIDIFPPSSQNPDDRFKVLTYNILCENATREQYNYTASRALQWEFRRDAIFREVEAADADIVCLQEVDGDSFEEFFRVKLAYLGYKGVFWPKSRARNGQMSLQSANRVDGCATFYRQAKFILLDKQVIDFGTLAINRADMKGQADIYNRVGPKDQMAVLTFFECRATGSRLVVANGHLFWDPQFPDIKLIQTAIMMDTVNKHAERYALMSPVKDKKVIRLPEENDGDAPKPLSEPAPSMEYSSPSHLPMLFCVDLNSEVHSSVYELLDQGSVSADHKDLQGRTYGVFTRDGISHPWSLKSAYSHLDGDETQKMTFTNYVPSFKGVIDHVFYSTNNLEVLSLMGKIDDEYMKRVPGFPNFHHPSDHIPLLVEFAVKAKKEKKSHPEPDFGSSSKRDRRD